MKCIHNLFSFSKKCDQTWLLNKMKLTELSFTDANTLCFHQCNGCICHPLKSVTCSLRTHWFLRVVWLPHLSILVSLDPLEDMVCILTTLGLALSSRGLLSINIQGSSVHLAVGVGQFSLPHSVYCDVKKLDFYLCSVSCVEGMKLITWSNNISFEW